MYLRDPPTRRDGAKKKYQEGKKVVGTLALSDEQLIEAYLQCPEETLTVEPYCKKDGSLGFRFVPKKPLIHFDSNIFHRSGRLRAKKPQNALKRKEEILVE
jgi:hypothetical protein